MRWKGFIKTIQAFSKAFKDFGRKIGRLSFSGRSDPRLLRPSLRRPNPWPSPRCEHHWLPVCEIIHGEPHNASGKRICGHCGKSQFIMGSHRGYDMVWVDSIADQLQGMDFSVDNP